MTATVTRSDFELDVRRTNPFRIAVFNLDIVGTLNPVLPVIAELVARGCEVHYYLRKESLAQKVEEAGATVHFFDGYLGRWEELLAEEKPWLEANGCEIYSAAALGGSKSLPLQMLDYSLPAGLCLAKRLLEKWSEKTETHPHLILHNVMLLHPVLAAKKLGVPCVSFSTYPGPGTPMLLSEISPQDRESWDRALAAHPATQSANEVAKREFGLDVVQSQLPCRHYSQQLNLMFSVPELDGDVADYQKVLLNEKSFLWVGSTGNLQHRTTSEGDAREITEGQPMPWIAPSGIKVLIVSLGTLTVDMRWDSPEHMSSVGAITGREFSERIWGEVLESFRGRHDLRVILGIGPRASLEDLPENFVAMEHFDQMRALEHADAIITHGGFNSIKEALIACVPMIVVPFCVDQPSNGDTIQRNCAGVTFPDIMATPRGKLSEAVEAALWGTAGAAQKGRSKALGHALQNAGGAKVATSACLELLEKHCRVGAAEMAGA